MKANAIIPLLTLKSLPGDLSYKIQTLEAQYTNGYTYDSPAHSHDHYELIWITNGSGVCHIDLGSHQFFSNAIFCIRPGQVHQLRTDEPVLTGFSISFDKAFLNEDELELHASGAAGLLHIFPAGQGIGVPDEIAAGMGSLALAMIREFEQCYPFRMQIIKRLFKLFCIYLTRHYEATYAATSQTREVALAEQFICLLEKNYRKKKMVSDYARLLFITPNYLSEVVKRTTGISAGQHIRKRIALEAKRMGRYSGSCMKEIAYDLGFVDSAHFSKFFKTVSGKNFTDFKKENNNGLQIAYL